MPSKMWMKSLIHSQISTGVPLKFGNWYVISSHIFYGCNYLSILGLKWMHVRKRGPRCCISHMGQIRNRYIPVCCKTCRTLFLFVSLLSHFWLLFYLHLLYQPYVGLCQATRFQSHQRQSTSAVPIATCEVQVSAADYQTVPTVATGVSKPLCCRLTLTFTLTSENLSLYIILLLWLVVIQLCSPRCWHLDSNYCRTRCRQSQLRFVLSPLLLHLHLLIVPVGYSTFTLTWPAKHSPNQGWESTHRLHLYPLGGVFYSP